MAKNAITKKSDILDRLYKEYFEAICTAIKEALPSYNGWNEIRLSSENEDYSKINIPTEIRDRVESAVAEFFLKEGGWKIDFANCGSWRFVSIR